MVRVASTAPSSSLAAKRNFGELLRSLLHDRPASGQGHSDATELALIVVTPVRAGLDHRAGERIQVQQADLPVRNPVLGGQIVIAGAALARCAGEPPVALEDRVALVLGLQDVRRAGRGAVVGRHRDRVAARPRASRSRTARPHPGAARSGPRRAVRALADRRSRSPSGPWRPHRGSAAKAARRRLPARSRSWRAPRTVYFAIRVVSFSKRKVGLPVKRGMPPESATAVGPRFRREAGEAPRARNLGPGTPMIAVVASSVSATMISIV